MTELPRNPDGSIDVRSQEFYQLRADTFMSRPARDMWMIATLLAGFDPDELWQEIRRRRAGRRPVGRINEPTVLNAMDALMRRHRPELANRQGGSHEDPA